MNKKKKKNEIISCEIVYTINKYTEIIILVLYVKQIAFYVNK